MYLKTAILTLGILFLTVGSTGDDWWKTVQLYQIYPRSFKDSDGDGIGDIKGIISKLDHLQDIGVQAIWLSPIFPSPMKDFGYDISDFRNIDKLYGTMTDFDNLLTEAKKKGIRVLLDFVPNHTSDEHEWFKKSVANEIKYKDYYVWHKGKSNPIPQGQNLPPSNWISVFRGSAWTSAKDFTVPRDEYYLHQFLKEQPDLNYRNPDVVKEMEEILKFWLDKGVDGFRVDAIPHLVEAEPGDNGIYPDEPISGQTEDKDSYDYLTHIHTRERAETYEQINNWRKVLDEYSNTRILCVEAYSDLKIVMKYYGNKTNPGAHFPFNFEMFKITKNMKANGLKNILTDYMDALPDDATANWVVGNHDQPRLSTRLGSGLADITLMLTMLLPGVSVTYQGEEIGMENHVLSWEDTKDPQACNSGKDKFGEVSRDPARTPFHWDDTTSAGFSTNKSTWLPIPESHKTLNLAKQKEAEKSTYKYYKQLSKLRKEIKDFDDLDIETLNDDIFMFSRNKGNESIYIVANMANKLVKVGDIKTKFDDITENLKVVAASVNSDRALDTIEKSSGFEMKAYEALAFRPHSGASTLMIMSMFNLIIFTIIFSIFNKY